MRYAMEKKQITLRVPENIDKQLKELAERIGITKHEVIMIAIDKLLKEKN